MPDDDRPVIGLTINNTSYAKEYAAAIERSGGRPWLILPGHDLSPKDTAARMDGLLVCGGEDIHPRWYGHEPQPGVELTLNEARDDAELPVLEAALDADLPTLGICRGMQALNVVMGGELLQHIENHSGTSDGDNHVSDYHRIFITPGSLLASVVGSGGFVRVNSIHHQAVREAQKAPGLLASAYSLEDGYVEALESPTHSWVLAVQFHPERRKEIPPHFDRLFDRLVAHAASPMSFL